MEPISEVNDQTYMPVTKCHYFY